MMKKQNICGRAWLSHRACNHKVLASNPPLFTLEKVSLTISLGRPKSVEVLGKHKMELSQQLISIDLLSGCSIDMKLPYLCD